MNSDSNDLKPSQLCQRINRVCLRQNSEPLAGGLIFWILNSEFWTFSREGWLIFILFRMICSAQCGAERGEDLLQIRNTKFRGEILGNFSTVLRPRGTLIPLRPYSTTVQYHSSLLLLLLLLQCHCAIPQFTVLLLSCSRFQSVELRGPRVCS